MSTQSTEVQPQPQGDGADRPFDLGTMPQNGGPFRLMTETRGPAFDPNNNRVAIEHAGYVDGASDFLPVPIADELGRSLVAQSFKVAGEVLNALTRRCLLDVCASWPRLLTTAGVVSVGARRHGREPWQWQEMKEAVELAFCYAEQLDSLKWQDADALLRGYALSCAMAIESRLSTPDAYDPQSRGVMAGQAAVYRAFAEGRA